MAIHRPVKTATWTDPKFQEWSILAKVLFLFLITNKDTSESGVYPITFKTIKFYTGIEINDIDKAFTREFKKSVRYDYKNNVVFVKNFLRHNAYGRPDLVQKAISKERRQTRTSLWKDFDKCYPCLSANTNTNTNTTSRHHLAKTKGKTIKDLLTEEGRRLSGNGDKLFEGTKK